MLPVPVVSVVVPTRNRCDAVVACLAGLAAQTHSAFEVIVVDDGSTDGTAEAVARFAASHPGLDLTFLRNDPAAGANPSRNRGIDAARGDVVAFIDDDAVAEPAWLERLATGITMDVGAVTGLTLSARPRNVWELTLKGTQRVHATRFGRATRLVGTNMAVLRSLLQRFPLDEDRAGVASDMAVSGRSDEEGLYLQLRAAGFAPRVVNDAVVHHDHPHTASSFFRQAFRGGRSAARLVYKYRLPPRVDVVPFVLGYLTLPLGFVSAWWLLVPAACFGLGLAAITYNDLFRKRKTPGATLVTLPLLVAYYQVRAAGYVLQTVRLKTGRDRLARV